jgi:hypothetical protein
MRSTGKQNHDPVADAEAKLRAAERVIRDIEQKSERIIQRGKEIGDQIAKAERSWLGDNERRAHKRFRDGYHDVSL